MEQLVVVDVRARARVHDTGQVRNEQNPGNLLDMSTSSQPRIGRGVPDGGQFSTRERPETSVRLEPSDFTTLDGPQAAEPRKAPVAVELERSDFATLNGATAAAAPAEGDEGFEECSACGGDYNYCECMACDRCGDVYRTEELVFGPDNVDDGDTVLCIGHAIRFGLIEAPTR